VNKLVSVFCSVATQTPIWIESAAVNKLTAMRGPGESYSDVILWLAEIEAKGSNS